MNSVWRWVDPKTVREVHDHQVAEHGGLKGVRDDGAIDSALARPKNLVVYSDQDAAALAASYAWGIANNLIDGNKRTAWVTDRLFLCDSGRTPTMRKRSRSWRASRTEKLQSKNSQTGFGKISDNANPLNDI